MVLNEVIDEEKEVFEAHQAGTKSDGPAEAHKDKPAKDLAFLEL